MPDDPQRPGDVRRKKGDDPNPPDDTDWETFGDPATGEATLNWIAMHTYDLADGFTKEDYTTEARADDFLHGRPTRNPRRSSYTFGTVSGRVDRLLPARVRDAVGRALERFDRQVPGFAGPDGILVGLESRSSGPVRLPRDPQREGSRGRRRP